MRGIGSIATLVVVLAGLLVAHVARADSWFPATRKVYVSPDGHTRLTVTPRALRSSLDYYQDKVDNKDPAGQAAQGPKTANGVLERQDGGVWKTVWSRPLVNDVSPVSAIVADSGGYVVTFDDWYSIGTGKDVVVIYRTDGSLVRELRLIDFLPLDYITALPTSVSSIGWRSEHRFSAKGDQVILKVVVPKEGDGNFSREPSYVDVAIELESGKVIPPSGAAWDAAYATAKRVSTVYEARAKARRAAWSAPLLAPQTLAEQAWRDYLREAYYRMAETWPARYPRAYMLQDVSASNYKVSKTWLTNAVAGQGDEKGGVIVVASPSSPDNLLAVVTDATKGIKPGWLKDIRLYIFVPPDYRERFNAAFASSGAKVILIDPAIPIPQRPERLPKTPDPDAKN